MKSPIQAAPVARRASVPASAGAVVQSGCCVQVAGVCLVSSPIC